MWASVAGENRFEAAVTWKPQCACFVLFCSSSSLLLGLFQRHDDRERALVRANLSLAGAIARQLHLDFAHVSIKTHLVRPTHTPPPSSHTERERDSGAHCTRRSLRVVALLRRLGSNASSTAN